MMLALIFVTSKSHFVKCNFILTIFHNNRNCYSTVIRPLFSTAVSWPCKHIELYAASPPSTNFSTDTFCRKFWDPWGVWMSSTAGCFITAYVFHVSNRMSALEVSDNLMPQGTVCCRAIAWLSDAEEANINKVNHQKEAIIGYYSKKTKRKIFVVNAFAAIFIFKNKNSWCAIIYTFKCALSCDMPDIQLIM